ncbi:uncharacterized protein LOC122788354 isoform X2 [Protopterus annectens]|nr:uncharacterized protein LOC122788354 isoform X2 [Protopterus annectens]
MEELLEKFKKAPECDTMANIKIQLADYESTKLKNQQLNVRMGLSKKICRFELPMDMKVIENISPQEYLTNYCLVCKRRQVYYKKTFDKFDKNKTGLLSLKDVERAVRDLYQNEINIKQVQDLTGLLCMEEETKVDFKLFLTFCALSERVFYSFFVTEDTEAESGTKHELEKADFCSLKWKLHGCNIDDGMMNFLGHI